MDEYTPLEELRVYRADSGELVICLALSLQQYEDNNTWWWRVRSNTWKRTHIRTSDSMITWAKLEAEEKTAVLELMLMDRESME